VHLELEDGVPLRRKPEAREKIVEALTSFDWAGQRTFVRVDSTNRDTLYDDIVTIVPGSPTGFLLGKCASGETVAWVDDLLTARETHAGLPVGQTKIAVMIERLSALNNADEIATASARMVALSFGPGDLGVEYGYRRSFRPLELETLVPRSLTVMAAHSAGLEAWDSVYLFYRDQEETARAAQWSYRLGFDLQKCASPRQIEVVAREFGPSPADIEWARAVVSGQHEAALSDNEAVWSSAGTMNDGPTVVLAHEYLDWRRNFPGSGADHLAIDKGS
jgi:citrate lyase subunit beta/citryl-CoA lyase